MPAAPNRPQGQRPQPGRAVVQANRQAPATHDDPASRAVQVVSREIDNRMAIVEASAAAGIKPERLKLVALTAFTRNPDLLKCDPVSVARAIVESAQLGLEPTGLLGGAYLVPRAGKATLLVGYKGLVMLAKRSGEVSRVEARVVRGKDVFAYAYGLVPRLDHVPYTGADDPGNYTYAYAVIHYRDGTSQFDVMSHAEIDVIRKRSAAGNAGPWVTDYPEMAKKTVLRRLLKLAPLSVQVAAQLDDLDPETTDAQPEARADAAQVALKRRLQAALDREYGGGSGQEEVEGQSRELPNAGETTQATGNGTASGEAPKAEGAQAPRADGEGQQAQAVAGAPAAAAPATEAATITRQASKPERVSEVLSATCGASHEQLQVGPCVLPAGHTEAPWRDTSGGEHPAQNEHEEAGGTRWTQPKEARS